MLMSFDSIGLSRRLALTEDQLVFRRALDWQLETVRVLDRLGKSWTSS